MHFRPLLAEKYKTFDLDWYLASEKVDGYRAMYFNGIFWTRTGNVINAPEWFTRDLPLDIFLDGELFTKRGDFNGVSSILRKKVPIDREWKKIVYLVFDAPKVIVSFTERFRYIKDKLETKSTDGYYFDTKFDSIKVLKQYKVNTQIEIERIHTSIVKMGGEGVMMRDPDSYYANKRDNSLLKYKHFHDSEAIVDDFEFGNGKNECKMGKLWVRWLSDGVLFKVGGGFSDDQRVRFRELFPKGTIIKVKYFEKSALGQPRFPIYVGTIPKGLCHSTIVGNQA
jgi:DNA ligase-1